MKTKNPIPANCRPLRVAAVFAMALACETGLAQSTTVTVREFSPGAGRFLKSQTVDGVTTRFTYNNQGDVETVTDARGYVTRYSNYRRGIAQTEVTAEGRPEQVTMRREVNDIGCITSETDGENNTTFFGRDEWCRVTSISRPEIGSNLTRIYYNSATQSSPENHILDRGGYYREYSEFDGFGRLVVKTSGGVKQIWRYDALGRKTFASFPEDSRVGIPGTFIPGDGYFYDALNRTVNVSQFFGASITYDYFRSVSGAPQIRVTDERLQSTTYTFKHFGTPSDNELVAIETPVAAANTVLERNIRGQITRVTQGGFTRTNNYDSRYLLTSAVHPETGTTIMGRDNLGHLTSISTGGSGTTYYDIDGVGNVYAIRYPDSSKNVSQTWYRNGLRKSANTSGSALSWVYDANKNLNEQTLTVGGRQFTLSYRYDGNDKLESLRYPLSDGSVVDFAPDERGRPTKVGSLVTSVSYHPNDSINSMKYGNGVVTTVQIDERQRPSNLTVSRVGVATPFVDFLTQYDAANNLILARDTANPSNTRTYGYDGINRLSNVRYANVDYPIQYDGSGNIKRQTFGGVLDYTYSASNNRLISTSGIRNSSFSYDTRSNVTSNGSTAFQYDDNSRLICAKCNVNDRINYAYDALGSRISRTKGGKTTYLLHGPNNELLFEFDTAANKRVEHVYLQGQRVATNTQAISTPTTVTLRASQTALQIGQSVTLTATVTGRNPSGGVMFLDNGESLGTARVVNGVATLTVSLPPGNHDLSASYWGDAANLTSATRSTLRVQSGNPGAIIMNIINSLLLD